MTDLLEFVTESEAARMLGLAPGKGSAWRSLRGRVTIHQVGNIQAVRRDDLVAHRSQETRRHSRHVGPAAIGRGWGDDRIPTRPYGRDLPRPQPAAQAFRPDQTRRTRRLHP